MTAPHVLSKLDIIKFIIKDYNMHDLYQQYYIYKSEKSLNDIIKVYNETFKTSITECEVLKLIPLL
jgi:hypothetical protein